MKTLLYNTSCGESSRGRSLAGAWEPVAEADPGHREAPLTVAFEHAWETFPLPMSADAPLSSEDFAMRTIHAVCCGLDVHKRNVTACLHRCGASGETTTETRTFATTTGSLLELADWLVQEGCRHVAMESTGVYWRPVFNLLEGVCDEVLLVNAQHIKQVPGRKTDVKDAEWIAELLAHGLLRGSFIPPSEIRDLRELTRYRSKLVQQRADQCNRIQKHLEGGNLKLASFITDILGVSGRAMLEALAAGETNVVKMAEMAQGRMRKKIPQLREALRGSLNTTQRWLLKEQLEHVTDLDQRIARLSEKIEELCRPFFQQIQQLTTMPGVSRRMAENVISEVGVDMTRFGNEHRLAAWAGMCPGQNQTGGKQGSGRRRKGSHWLRAALTEAGWAASHTKNNYLSAQYRNIARRRGKKRACVAVGHTILCIAYHLLSNPDAVYRDLGADYFGKQHKDRLAAQLLRRLSKLGYRVTLTPAA
jgi:transposase